MEFHEHLKTSRVSLGLTQVQLAKHFGITSRTLIHWENGEIVPNGLTRVGAYAKLTELQNKTNHTHENGN